MKKVLSALAIAGIFGSSGVSWGVTTSTAGTITQYSSIAEGLIIMTSGPLPTACNGTPYGWMLIPQANTTMIATALTAVILGKQVAVWTSAAGFEKTAEDGTFCTLSQLQPYL